MLKTRWVVCRAYPLSGLAGVLTADLVLWAEYKFLGVAVMNSGAKR